jgi:peptidoglycan/xylan/chitin deacetylase (PgdA/CDA1 family)
VFRVLFLSFALLGLGFQAPAVAANAPWRIPVLVYHRFDAGAAGLTTVRLSVFADQLEWLKTKAIAVLPLHVVTDDITRRAPPGNGLAVALTADDGHRSVYSEMYPLLRRYGVHATLFIYPSAISNADWALTWEQLDEMVGSGLVDVQSHTYWHPNFNIEKRRLEPEAYRRLVVSQLTLSKSRLETRLGIKVDLLAWPFGIHDLDLAREAAAAGYVAAFTIERKPLEAGADAYALPRFLVTDADSGARFAALVMGATGRKAPR